MQGFLSACAYTSSKKLITEMLDTDQKAAFTSLTTIYEGLSGYASYKTTYYDTN